MRILRRVVPVAVGLALVATTMTSCEWPEGTRYVHRVFAEVDVTTGVTYRTTTTNAGAPIDLKLDIYAPRGDTAAERPVIMWGFGGGWRFGDRAQLAAFARDAAERGYVGVAIDYRIWVGDGFDLVRASNNAYDDTIAAVEWLRAHAATYRIDADAVVAAGYSAGAINALNAIHRPADSPAAGAVAIAGTSFSPEGPGHPPSIVFSGDQDQVLAYSSQKASCDRSRANGNVCEQVTYAGADHLIPFTQGDDIRARTADFVFEQVLWPLGYRPESVPAAAA